MTKHHLEASKKWGFNFLMGYPMPGHKRYEWERVPPTNSIPEMYTLSRAAHLREVKTEQRCELNDLLDERAEQSYSDDRLLDLEMKQRAKSRLSTTTTTPRLQPTIIIRSRTPSSSPSSKSTREKRQPRITGEQMNTLFKSS